MKTYIVVTFRVPGFHNWPDAPATHAHLSVRHRHEFVFRAEFEVATKNRELEFHTQQAVLRNLVLRSWPTCELGLEFGAMSCEMIAERVLHGLRAHAVEVWEDSENGARVEA